MILSRHRLYSLDEMRRHCSASGHFVHASEAGIEWCLLGLYRDVPEDLFRRNAMESHPRILFDLHESGHIPPVFYAESALIELSRRIGLFCHLCSARFFGDGLYRSSPYDLYGSESRFFCDKPLVVFDREEKRKGGVPANLYLQSVCYDCRRAYLRYFTPPEEDDDPVTSEAHVLLSIAGATHALVAKSKSFHRRARDNRKTKIRFDPRRRDLGFVA